MPIPRSLASQQQARIAKKHKLASSRSITRILWRHKICEFSTLWHTLSWNLSASTCLTVAISSALSSGSMKQRSSKSIFLISIQKSGAWLIENRRGDALIVAQTLLMRQASSSYPNFALEMTEIKMMTISLANWWWLKTKILTYHVAFPIFWP